ncbi:rhomboid family intramembrane serine protease [Pedobacter frigiditerrae]|uniref:Rhomboid family intramembrane serine protease n=1 Tax=Pedobacter frigiditerrae TaxID=2530452 RepID=A0A4R0N3D7_9SPHI|nr:rhomboid family intramembrane serine protease [Pedobacter frigiditerrae]TCC94378.1 rhomboid family intramembrane serine protease [Pedobacter frigiditerrae]
MTNNIWNDLKLKFFKSGNPVMLYIGVNAAIFVVVSLLSVIFYYSGREGFIDAVVNEYLGFPSASRFWLSRFYTVLTYQFFHDGFFHILFNMLWLYWMGQIFLDFVKPRQFHFVYICGGILGAIFYALIFNIVPVFITSVSIPLIGSSAAVMAVFTAAATLVPNYSLRLMFVGEVKIKYLLLVYILLDLIGTTKMNAGGSLSHLGGALFGFVYVKLLQGGTDLSTIFKKKPKLRVVKNESPKKAQGMVNQKEVDAILDKISKTGYDKLTKEEKETLFKASKN